MKSRPLTMCPELVPAVLSGRKTMTRRPVKGAFADRACACCAPVCTGDGKGWQQYAGGGVSRPLACPLGSVGDGLWLRERARVLEYRHTSGSVGRPEARICYASDNTEAWVPYPLDRLKVVPIGRCIPNGVHKEGSRWRGIITEVRVERVQDITEADARAEGVTAAPFCKAGRPNGHEHIEAFEGLWRSIYPGSWERNDWCWVVRWEGGSPVTRQGVE